MTEPGSVFADLDVYLQQMAQLCYAECHAWQVQGIKWGLG